MKSAKREARRAKRAKVFGPSRLVVSIDGEMETLECCHVVKAFPRTRMGPKVYRRCKQCLEAALKTGLEVVQERAKVVGVVIPEDGMPLSFFDEIGLPMIVACTGCEMTMAITSPSVMVDGEMRVWCKGCFGN